MPFNGFTHLNAAGEAQMVDVSAKQPSKRTAVAQAVVRMQPHTAEQLQTAGMKKGDVLAVARVAGVQAAKRTDAVIPLCHSLPLSAVDIDFDLQTDATQAELYIYATCSTIAQTGVEMEALHAASITALTVYDMCKSIDKLMVIDDIMLLKKSGGQSGDFVRSSLAQ